MEDEQPDSLEGWVPLREDLFSSPERHQLRFLVAWNDAEGQFAVTCHDRTAQRRRRFPQLPPELDVAGCGARDRGRGLWALVWPVRVGLGETALQELCGQLERYLAEAADGCGGVTVRDALFPAESGAADCESPHELRERALRARRAEAGARLHQVLQGHEKANNMVSLMKIYQEEDEAYHELVTMATMFFQYLLQPFRDMREVATLCKLGILKSLDEDNLGPKRVVALQKEAKEWSRRAEEAVVSIQEITVNYFKETVKALAGMQKQMEQDGRRFGQAAWATATPRLEKLKLMLARETLQLMRAKELCLNHKRAQIQRKVEDLPEQEKNIHVVDELEIQYYEIQLELYEVKFEILKNEEILLTTQLNSIKRLIKEKQDEVVYYDPCESPEELKGMDHIADLQHGGNLEVKELSLQCQKLEAKRGRICARRASLRNRKDQCKENHRLRLQQAEESTRYFHQHHSIQMKRDKIKEEEQKKKEWINQERQKTLQRLRAYKEKYSVQSLQQTSCSEPGTPNLPADLPQQRSSPVSQLVSVAPPCSRKARSAPLVPEVCTKKTPKDQDYHRNIPVQIFVPVGDRTHFKSTANHWNLGLGTRVKDDQPRSLVCGSPAERPPNSLESFQCPGSMDEVLASLRHSRSPLQEAEVPFSPAPRTSVNEHILAAIRQGVKLRKVHTDLGSGLSDKPTSDLERSIKAALQRIKRVSADSEEDSDEQSPSEWDH
uniref:WASP homolog associated with actin, golgi membranes and microtubules n=1 Tax=Ictidomys tridecemlineatus TaxID=43179 RepID=I3MSK3_ICTTR